MFYGRGPNKIKNPYTIPEVYKNYVENIDKNSMYDVPYNTYRAIITSYFKEVVEFLFEKCLPFRFPSNLGTFQIVKKRRSKSKNLSSRYIDWVNTIKYGKVLYYTNEHSEGFRYFFMWIKDARLKNISKYKEE